MNLNFWKGEGEILKYKLEPYCHGVITGGQQVCSTEHQVRILSCTYLMEMT